MDRQQISIRSLHCHCAWPEFVSDDAPRLLPIQDRTKLVQVSTTARVDWAPDLA